MTTLLVGRMRELDLLFASADRAARGQGSVVHVVGEAGAGKSSLLAATAERLGSQQVTVRVGAADETDRRRRGAVLRALLPEFGLRRDHDPVEATIDAVERLAAQGPVALFADDLHWADDASLQALRAVGRRVEQLGVVLVTAGRPRPRSYGLARYEEIAAGGIGVLDLAPLATEHLDELVSSRLGGAPGPRLRELLAATEGNAFLATELLASLAGDTVVDACGVVDIAADAGVPDGLTERLASRAIAAVGGGELLLRALAVVPGGATVDELAMMLGRPRGELVATMLQGVGAAVLVDNGSSLAFRHELLRRCVQRSTPPSIARTLARLACDVLLAEDVDRERVAACLLAGADAGDPGDVERLLKVGASLRETHPSSAADLIAAGLDALPARDARVDALIGDLGWALIECGRAGEVDAMLAARLGPLDGDPSVGIHRLRGVAASLTGRLDAVAARYEGVDVEVLDGHDVHDADLVDGAVELAMLRIAAGRLGEAEAIVEWVEAIEVPMTPRRAAGVHVARAQLAAASGRFEATAEHARAAGRWTARDDLPLPSWSTGSLALAMALDQLGDADGSLAVVREHARLAILPRWTPPLLQFHGALTLYRRGEWDDATAEVDAGLVAADDVDLGMGVFWPHSVASLIATARGDVSGAESWLQRAHAVAPGGQLGANWLGHAAVMAAVAAGHVDRAVSLVELIVGRVCDAGAPAALLDGGPEMARIATQAGRVDLAKAIGHELAGVAACTRSCVASGLEQWTRGLLDDDATMVAEAGAVLARTGRRPEAARARHVAAVIAAGDGDLVAARGWAQQALATIDVLDAAHWRRHLLAELGAAGLVMRPRRRTARPTSGWASLTASEATIVSFVGQGCTNAAIAERLFVSRRTVESHLGRVYAKLDMSTRAELVAAAARR